MKIAVISDIHSNIHALNAVLDDIRKENIEELIVLGDMFGYYPWASETFKQITAHRAHVIKGNHDELLLRDTPPSPVLPYWDNARQNRDELLQKKPDAILWLRQLDFTMKISLNLQSITMVHGTPDDPQNGRYYPDDIKKYNWFPAKGEVLLMGHTHYPMIKHCDSGGVIINPGSVGQPRDGDPMPSWALLDLVSQHFFLKRTNYDHIKCMKELLEMNWDSRSIAALNKDYIGRLKED